MKKKYRLLKKVDFKEVLENGNKVFSVNFICYWIPSNSIKNAKIGVIIPKKKCFKSWRRKYLKRFFWSFNNKKFLSTFPKVKIVVFYRDYFYKKFDEGIIDFSLMRDEYFGIINSFSSKIF